MFGSSARRLARVGKRGVPLSVNGWTQHSRAPKHLVKNSTDSSSKLPVSFVGVLGWLGLGGKTDPEKEEDKLTTTIKRGILAIQEGDFNRADTMFHLALKLAQDLGHSEGETHIYCLMANLAMERRLLGQAERLFTTVLQRLLAAGEPKDSNAVVEISLKLAVILATNGEIKKAEEGFLFCAACQREKLRTAKSDTGDPDTVGLLGMVLDQFAQFLLANNRLQEAELIFKEAVEVATTLYGDKGEQTLVVVNSLASVLSMRGKDEEAANMLQEVVDKSDSMSDNLSSYLVNLGLIRFKQGRWELASSMCGQAGLLARGRGDKETAKETDKCLEEVASVFETSNKK